MESTKVKIEGNFKLKFIINQISAVLICVWMFWPFFNIRGRVISVVLFFIIWLFTTDHRWLNIKNWTKDLFFIAVFFVTFIPYIITKSFRYGDIEPQFILVSFPLFFVGIVLNHYYMYFKKDYTTLGRMALVSLLAFIVGSLQTYIGLEKYPMASRILATANDTMKELYATLGIGDFGYIYSATFISISLLFFLRVDIKIKLIYKVITLLALVLMLLMIVKASYAISLMIVFSGMFITFMIRKKSNIYLYIIFAIILIIIIPKNFIGNMLLSIAGLFEDNFTINSKFTDLASGFLSEGSGQQTSFRLQLYFSSLTTFFKNPLFGIYGPFGNPNYKVGGHSGWLDIMGLYGLFSAIPLFLGIFFNFKKQLIFYSTHQYFKYIFICQCLFVMFGLINPIIYIYEIGFTLFLLLPILPFLPQAFNRQHRKKDELSVKGE
ncbi:hypothetical protein [Paenibacillus sonchi]|uniref:hypothetical protein n=1 Tax=Paenibacillus sonchi TaxID=373687 RepID=UPI001E5840FD|nr:hypothetical protein [Paenibacillus sonchi]MCE3202840.1 hypothetical protein [Paenibacillus sonchi]